MIPELSEFPRDGRRVLSDGVVPTFHAVSSPNCSISRVEDGSKSRDESRERYDVISNSSINGAVWKIARSKAETTTVQNSLMDPLCSTSLDVPKSQTDTVLLNPVQKILMNEVSVPKILMDAETGQSSFCNHRTLWFCIVHLSKTERFKRDTIVNSCCQSGDEERG